MEFDGIGAVVAGKVDELRPDIPATWAACAAIWARAYASATPGLARWPAIRSMIDPALMAALSRSISDHSAPLPNHVDALGSFEIEDDGSDAWQHVVDLIAMLLPVLDGRDSSDCLRTALQTYLEGAFNVAAIALSKTRGRPISHADADTRLATGNSWQRARTFAESL